MRKDLAHESTHNNHNKLLILFKMRKDLAHESTHNNHNKLLSYKYSRGRMTTTFKKKIVSYTESALKA